MPIPSFVIIALVAAGTLNWKIKSRLLELGHLSASRPRGYPCMPCRFGGISMTMTTAVKHYAQIKDWTQLSSIRKHPASTTVGGGRGRGTIIGEHTSWKGEGRPVLSKLKVLPVLKNVHRRTWTNVPLPPRTLAQQWTVSVLELSLWNIDVRTTLQNWKGVIPFVATKKISVTFLAVLIVKVCWCRSTSDESCLIEWDKNDSSFVEMNSLWQGEVSWLAIPTNRKKGLIRPHGKQTNPHVCQAMAAGRNPDLTDPPESAVEWSKSFRRSKKDLVRFLSRSMFEQKFCQESGQDPK